MDNYFECIKCKYKTDLKVNMRKHLNKIKKCKKTIETIPYSDEEIFDLLKTDENIKIKTGSLVHNEFKSYNLKVDSWFAHK